MDKRSSDPACLDLQEILKFLTILHPHGSRFSLCAFGPGELQGPVWGEAFQAPEDAVVAIRDRGPGLQVFVSCGRIVSDPGCIRKGKPTKAQVLGLPALWVDVDAKDFPGATLGEKLEAAKAQIRGRWSDPPDGYPLPNLVVASGGGLHLWWLLAELLLLSGAEVIEQAEVLLRALATGWHGDPSSAEISRIMRLPGTPNLKPDRSGAIARIICDTTERVRPAIEQFHVDLPREPRPPRAVPAISNIIPSGTRNPALTSLAGSMRRRGMTEEAILAALLEENRLRVRPPLDVSEVRRIAASIARYDPADPALRASDARPIETLRPADLLERTAQAVERPLSPDADPILAALDLIPAETSKNQLPQRIDPILRALALLDRPSAEAYLDGPIKQRFKLKRPDVEAYRKEIADRRKANVREAGSVTQAVEPKFTAIFPGLVDLVDDEGRVAFLVKDGNGLAVRSEVEISGSLFSPPPKENIPWLLPRADQVLEYYELQQMLPAREADEALFEDLLAYHKSISELPSEAHYELIVLWVMHTYQLDATQYTPILCFFATPERGKSRTGKGLIYVAHRGIHVESMRDPYLVRVANDLGASLFVDVRDVWTKAERAGSEDILLHRFEKGATVPRVLYPDRGAHRDIVYYNIFGPTIIATNEAVHHILETRAVSMSMPESTRRFEVDVTPEAGLPLKERLVAFRARHLGEELGWVEKPASGRLGDILRPILQVLRLVSPEREGNFRALVLDIERGRSLERSEGLEAELVRVVVGLQIELERGSLPVKRIQEVLNTDRPEKAKLSPQRVGRLLKSLGFSKCRTGTGAAAILWDGELVRRLGLKYSVGDSSESSESSDSPPNSPDESDLSEDSEDPDRAWGGASRATL